MPRQEPDSRVVWPEVWSRLPLSWGTQEAWITSSEVSRRHTSRPTGVTSTLAVSPKSGYRYSNYYWWPTNSRDMTTDPHSLRSKIVRTVGTATVARIAAGITVHTTSKRTLCHGPWRGSVSSPRSEKATTATEDRRLYQHEDPDRSRTPARIVIDAAGERSVGIERVEGVSSISSGLHADIATARSACQRVVLASAF
jgi:hypothetical protein